MSTEKTRVLIIDDSDTATELIAAILMSDPELEVVGRARDGIEGVEMTKELRPDVITMDIHMPRMNGHEATRRIMSTTPTPIVVVTTISLPELVQKGLDILLEGALEIVQKPNIATNQGYQAISQELLDKVKTVSRISVTANRGTSFSRS